MRSRGLTRVDAVVFGVITVITLLFGSVALRPLTPHKERANQAKCANNLKQIALAAIEYSDDHHVFPHVGSPEVLDGGYKSNTATRVFRTLVWCTYVEDPEAFVCPSSADEYNPRTDETKKDLRAFRWEGAHGEPAPVSPLAPGGADAHDLPLDKATDLSYGWTRRAYSLNSTSSALLAADKSRIIDDDATSDHPWLEAHSGYRIGNHKDSMVGVRVDGHTVRLTPTSDGPNTCTVSSTDPSKESSGFLGVLGDQDTALGQ
jgi:hypothetical protein